MYPTSFRPAQLQVTELGLNQAQTWDRSCWSWVVPFSVQFSLQLDQKNRDSAFQSISEHIQIIPPSFPSDPLVRCIGQIVTWDLKLMHQ